MSYRPRILAAFRDLHRARKQVFDGDHHALADTRIKINDEFRKNLDEKDPSKVEGLLTLAADVAKGLRCSVVQLRPKEDEPDTYEMRITKDTVMTEHNPFDPNAILPEIKRGARRGKKSTRGDSSGT